MGVRINVSMLGSPFWGCDVVDVRTEVGDDNQRGYFFRVAILHNRGLCGDVV